MIPVRRLDRSNRPNSGWSSWPRTSSARRRPTCIARRRSPPASPPDRSRGRHHDRRAVDGADQRPQHAAEAMIERHRHADAVVGRVAQPLAGVIGVHQHVAVREHRPLGQAGRSRGELDVVDVRRARRPAIGLRARGRDDSSPASRSDQVDQPGPGRPSERDQPPEPREPRRRPVRERRRGHLGAERLDHLHEVRPLERRSRRSAWPRRPSSGRLSARGAGRPG